jgi:tetraprenyl-beta-curcumene synthase
MIRASVALVLANARYWPTVAPIARAQLHRWQQHAQKIPDHALRALALEKLDTEHFNSEVAATLAVTCPREYRACVVEAIVAFEVMYDYLDGLTEKPTPDPLRDGQRVFQAFINAVTPDTDLDTDRYDYRQRGDGDYLEKLANTVKRALMRLPAFSAVTATVRVSADRCASAQTLVHAAPQLGVTELERWSKHGAQNTGLEWQEFLAGAVASVLAVHALIAAAADRRTTPALADAIDTTYLSISAISTMLDSLIDYRDDIATDSPWYLRHYADDHDLLAQHLTHVAQHAAQHLCGLPDEAHHAMTLVGVVAYYTSAPAASSDLARPFVAQIHQELKPLITPTLAIMRAWRIAKRARAAITRRVRSGYTGSLKDSRLPPADKDPFT